MSKNVGPPNSWLRDQMIRMTNNTLNIINDTEVRINDRINDLVTGNGVIVENNIIISNITSTTEINSNIIENSYLANFNDILIADNINNNYIYTNNILPRANIYRIKIDNNSINNDTHIIVNNNNLKQLTIQNNKIHGNVSIPDSNRLNDIFITPYSKEELVDFKYKYSFYILNNNLRFVNGNLQELKIVDFENRRIIANVTHGPGHIDFSFDSNISSNQNGNLIFNGEIILLQEIFSDNNKINIGNENIATNIIGSNITITGNESNLLENNIINIIGDVTIEGNHLKIHSDQVIYSNPETILSHANIDLSNSLNVPNINTETIDFKHIPLTASWEPSPPSDYGIYIKDASNIRLTYAVSGILDDPSSVLISKLNNAVNDLNELIGYKIYLTNTSPENKPNPLTEENENIIIDFSNIHEPNSALNSLIINVSSKSALPLADAIFTGELNFVYQGNNITFKNNTLFEKDVHIKGNLNVDGIQSISNTESLIINDNKLILNGNRYQEDSGIIINTHDNNNAYFIWRNEDEYWDTSGDNMRINTLYVNSINSSGNIIVNNLTILNNSINNGFSSISFLSNLHYPGHTTLQNMRNNLSLVDHTQNFIAGNRLFSLRNIQNTHGNLWGSITINLNIVLQPSWARTPRQLEITFSIPVNGNGTISIDSMNIFDSTENDLSIDNLNNTIYYFSNSVLRVYVQKINDNTLDFAILGPLSGQIANNSRINISSMNNIQTIQTSFTIS